jgi:hypothetical protein
VGKPLLAHTNLPEKPEVAPNQAEKRGPLTFEQDSFTHVHRHGGRLSRVFSAQVGL